MTNAQLNTLNKDLRIRIDNLKIAKQISEVAFEEESKELRAELSKKDDQIHMLQKHIASREMAYERVESEKNDLQKELDKCGKDGVRERRDIPQWLPALWNQKEPDAEKSARCPMERGTTV